MAYTDIDDPSAYFQTTLWTGDGANSHVITNSGNSDLQPDWLWIKQRDATRNHHFFDSIRGVTKYIESDTNVAEETGSTTLLAFGSDGFTVGSGGRVNANTKTYVAWNWKAGTAVSGNTSGSGTAKAYSGSVNTDAGFSIIKYIGNGTANHKIPHHLGAVLNWIIVKNLAETENWQMFHQSLGNTKTMSLNLDEDEYGADNRWNNTSPTSSLFNLGNGDETNKNDVSYIAYSFAEKQGYSKFGSHIGDGNANGPFIYTGFKVGWVMIKRTDDADNWVIYDNKRDGFNGDTHALFPNNSAAQTTDVDIDLLSNGFKIVRASGRVNASGGSFIYMAFAENPLVTSKGVPATAK